MAVGMCATQKSFQGWAKVWFSFWSRTTVSGVTASIPLLGLSEVFQQTNV